MNDENVRLRILEIPPDEENIADVKQFLSELGLGACKVEKITRERGQPSSAVISTTNIDAAEKLLRSGREHKIHGGHCVHILPEVFERVTVRVNRHWIAEMNRYDMKCAEEILKDVCQKTGVKLERSPADGYLISGHLEAVTRSMAEIHAVDCRKPDIGARQQQMGDTPWHVTENDRSDGPAGGKSNYGVANPPAGRQRRLKAPNAADVDVRGTEIEKQQTAADSKQAKDKPARRLKVATPAGEPEPEKDPARSDSQDENDTQHGETMPVKMSCRRLKESSSVSGNTERSTLDRSITMQTVKHHHIISQLSREFKSIVDRCISFNAQEYEDDTIWTFEAESREELNAIETQIKKVISRLSSADVAIPAGVDVESVKAVCATNKHSDSVTVEVSERKRLCSVCGTDAAKVRATENWLMDEMMPDQRQNPAVPVGTAGRDRDETKSDGDGTKSSFVVQVDDHGDALRLTTASGISVHIHQADMLRQQTEVIVNSANNQLAHGAGLARAILTAGGQTINDESRRIVAERGPLQMGDVVHTSAGNIRPPVRYVIHAVPPTDHQMKTGNQQECTNALIRAFYGSMQYANDQLGASSISLPPFGAGIFAIAVDKITRAAFTGLREFDSKMSHGSSSSSTSDSRVLRSTRGSQRSTVHCLKDIHIISNDAKITRQIIDAFKSMLTDAM